MCRYHQGMTAAVINPYRLSRNVLPQEHRVHLAPDLATGLYDGESTTIVKVEKPTDEIVLNAITFEGPEGAQEKVLEIGEATITRSNGTAFTGIAVPDPKTQRLHIKVNGTIGSGIWHLKLRFKGRLNRKMKGFYLSSYKDDAGSEHRIATTQFEATDARRAFPCFDEPALKQRFQLSMTIDENLAAVSNGRLMNTTSLNNGKKLVEFSTTETLPTYVYAFVVGNLVATKPVIVDGVEVRVWCRPGKEHLAKFALKMAQFALRFYRQKYNCPYPFGKLDMLAIPDFQAGAMENAACITYREADLLVDEALASIAQLTRVAHVVAHEIAHMWFGDLVTMDYWEGLWLNEAFATLMENLCVDAWKRAWGTWDQFGLSRAAAFDTDSLKSTRPVEYEVIAPSDADGMFDILTYEKGCSVLRMLMMFMGEDTFFKGIQIYIKRHAWGNAKGADLWSALAEASGMPVAEIMHGWIYTPGFPVVSASLDDGGGSVTISQQQFKYLSDAVSKDQLWQIPVMLRAKTKDGIVEMKHMLSSKEETVYVGEGLEWVVVNAGGHGYYRVLYSDNLRTKLTSKPMETLSVIERVNVVSDEWACVQGGLSNSLAFISLIKLLREETDPNVWSAMTGPLGRMKRILPAGKRHEFAAVVRDLVAPTFARLGWEPKEGESTQESELRGDLIATLALTGDDKPAQDKAEELFKAWKADRTAVDGDVIGPVISIVAANGDEADFQDFYSLFKSAQSPQEEAYFRSALCGFRDGELLKRTLNLCLDPNEIRTQDSAFLLARIMMSEKLSEHTWQFTKNNWDKLNELYSNAGMIRVCSAFPHLTTAQLEADVQSFMAAHPIEGMKKMVDQLLEKQSINRRLRERETPVLEHEFAQAA